MDNRPKYKTENYKTHRKKSIEENLWDIGLGKDFLDKKNEIKKCLFLWPKHEP